MQGILLDADHISVGDETCVRLYVAHGDTRKQLVVPAVRPYFYVVPNGAEPLDRLASVLRMRAKRAIHETPRDDQGNWLGWENVPCPVTVEEVERKIHAKPLVVLKVTCQKPKHARVLREEYRRVSGVRDVREANLYLPKRYLIDHDLRPLNLVKTTGPVAEREGHHVVPGFEDAGEADLSGLRVLAFDFEMVSKSGFPQASRDPIALCSWATSEGATGCLSADELPTGELDDSGLVRALRDLILAYDPDIVLTYNGDEFDWPYLVARADLLGIPLDLGRDGSSVELLEIGERSFTRCKGRALVDLYVMVERDILDLRDEQGKAIAVKSLKNVAEALGVVRRDERVMVEGTAQEDKGRLIARLWRDDRQRLIQYAVDDVVSTLGVGAKLLPAQYDMCRLTRNPLSDAYRASRGQQVELFLWDAAYNEGEVVPPRPFRRKGTNGSPDDEDQYDGAYVFEPEAGLHEDVQWMDFEALYPSIMISRNVGPDTYVAPHEIPRLEAQGVPLWTSPAGHTFRQDRDSFFKKVLVRLKEYRLGTKKAKKQEEDSGRTGSADWTRADNRDKAFKALINSFYGFVGWKDAAYYHEPSAVSVTSEGVRAIKRVAQIAAELGMHVLAGDTDSVALRNWTKALLRQLAERVAAEMPLKLDEDETFSVMFFTGRKKRYCGLTVPDAKGNQHIIVKGLETRRTDWCELAKQLQMECIEILLRRRDPDAAMRQARKTVQSLLQGEVPLSQLVVWKRLTKPPEQYGNKQAHVEAVKRALARRPEMRFPIGEKVGYVIVEGDAEGITDRSLVAQLFDPNRDRADRSYYNERQVMPAALRVLEYFGYQEDDLLGRPAQKSLEMWFN